MSDIPAELKYTKEHEWLQLLDDGTARIGITDYAQQSLGDVTFVELPNVGDTFAKGETFGVVESVKAASDLYMPIAGEIVAVNEDLADAPERLNDTPYEDGWIIQVKLEDPNEVEDLLDAGAYGEIAG
ncbi:MAG: glycine cleavage system protein GcvH [Verrucomicrobiota bacterium JB022]|nr:glycine cleavage system protein GcvH [Verrucomicrobiota bacterium JB022]